MHKYQFNTNITALVSNFLKDRAQCVKYGDQKSSYIESNVGAPQGTKLGPILWLIYSNDLAVPGFEHIKYADDVTFYTTVTSNLESSAIAPAISSTQKWADENSMLLNAEKSELMNTYLNYKYNYSDVVVVDDALIQPNAFTKFLGIFIDDKLSFNKHIDTLVTKCNTRLFLMRKLKSIGLDSDGLRTFYLSNIRPIICYASPAWFSLIGDTNCERLEQLQRSASKIIMPDHDYEDRLGMLRIPYLSSFLFDSSYSHFTKILNDESHPLYSRLSFNSNRTSSRAKQVFRPKRCRTTKRSNSFFNYFMTYHDNGLVYRT